MYPRTSFIATKPSPTLTLSKMCSCFIHKSQAATSKTEWICWMTKINANKAMQTLVQQSFAIPPRNTKWPWSCSFVEIHLLSLMGSISTCSISSCVHTIQHQSEPAMLTLRPLYADAKASCACPGLQHLGLLCLGLLPKCAFSWWSKGASAGRCQLHQWRHGAWTPCDHQANYTSLNT